MENSKKNKRKVKDIFLPHELNNYPSSKKEIKTEEIPIRFINKPKTERKIEEIESEENITITASSLREKFAKKEKKVNKRFKILLYIFFSLIVFYYLGFVLLAKAEINITTKKMEMPFSGTVLIDRNVFATNFSEAVIPGNLFVFKADETQEFSSTGQGKDEIKAKGIITIYNNYSTSPQILVATTRFETPDNKIFHLDSRIVIPGASTKNGELISSTIDVKVTADKPGTGYNIEACNLPDCKFTIPGFGGTSKFDGFYGVSAKAMAGGSFGSIPLVTSEDLKNAEEIILQIVMDSIGEDLQNKIPKGLKVLPEAKSGIKITNVDSDAKAGDYREKFTVSAEGEVNIVAFNEDDIIKYVQAMSDEEKDEDYEYCGKPELEYSEFKTNFNEGTLKISVKTNQVLCHKLSLEEIKQVIAGKNRKELDQIFESNSGIENVEVKLWPLWIRKVPTSLKKINLFVD